MTTVLLLEDNPELALMLRQVLEWRGFAVLHGTSGEEGLVLLQASTSYPDLIMCDLIMPDMDGPAFLSALQAHDRWSKIPFVVMSAHDEAETAAEASVQGARGFLPKPFGLNDLDAVLHQCGLTG